MSPKLQKYPKLQFSCNAWYYVHPRDSEGKRRWERLSKDKAKAIRMWADIEAFKHTGTPTDNFKQLAEHYQLTEMTTLSSGEQYNRTKYIAKLNRSFGAMSLPEIKPAHIQKFINIYAAKHPNAARKIHTLISVIINQAMREGLTDITQNPCTPVKIPKIVKRDRIPTAEEFRIIWQMADPILREVMIIAQITGWDLGDIVSIKMEHITPNGIKYKRSKTKSNKRMFEMTDDLAGCIKRLKALRPHQFTEYLILGKLNKPISSRAMGLRFRRLQIAAMESGALKERYQFRDLRALAATLAHEDGRDVQQLLSHTTERQSATYIRSKETVIIKPNESILKAKK